MHSLKTGNSSAVLNHIEQCGIVNSQSSTVEKVLLHQQNHLLKYG